MYCRTAQIELTMDGRLHLLVSCNCYTHYKIDGRGLILMKMVITLVHYLFHTL